MATYPQSGADSVHIGRAVDYERILIVAESSLLRGLGSEVLTFVAKAVLVTCSTGAASGVIVAAKVAVTVSPFARLS